MRRHERDMRKLASKFGRELVKRKKHWAFVCPRGRRPMVFYSDTPGDARGERNLLQKLRHAERTRT